MNNVFVFLPTMPWGYLVNKNYKKKKYFITSLNVPLKDSKNSGHCYVHFMDFNDKI